ncbi:MAG TPA: hypothetical protein VH327_00465 [Gammaproteobacteria bacterium]|jgi:hypothetical protein|nr:hypothetical protein [Gammaproteobacteria bacterium]
MSRALTLTSVAALALIAGCTWVTQSPEALKADIVVVDAAGAAHCQKIAANQLSVADHLGTIQRMPEDVEHDLRTMAINQAATVGADAVAPVGELKGGVQTWALLRCEGKVPAASMATSTAPEATTGLKTLPYTPPQ